MKSSGHDAGFVDFQHRVLNYESVAVALLSEDRWATNEDVVCAATEQIALTNKQKDKWGRKADRQYILGPMNTQTCRICDLIKKNKLKLYMVAGYSRTQVHSKTAATNI